MKRCLRSAALLLLGLFTAIPILAECPEGKSEVTLMTPRGITKTICVSDNAIPGIENAAEHSARVMIAPECPCLDVWDGTPYPQGTYETGIAPKLPTSIPPGSDCTALQSAQTAFVEVRIEDQQNIYTFNAQIRDFAGDQLDECSATDRELGGARQGSALFTSLEGEIFPDAVISPTGVYTSSMMDACKAVLEARGCVFE